MSKTSGFAYFLAGCLFALLLASQFAFRETAEKKEKSAKDRSETNTWYAPEIPAELSFAGEKAPLNRWDVKEKFDKEFLINYYDQGVTIYLIKLAQRDFPVITERLKANGVPEDFKYLCIAESNMQSWARSKSGAVGYWQFMKTTAPGYGLETNSQVDERKHLAKSTDAACKFFKHAYERFGNWTAAAASFNCGMAGYNRQATFQKTTNYYDLDLPEETNKYIFRILTFKYLMEHARDLGFVVRTEEKYPPIPSREIAITATIPNLAQFAIDNGTTYKTLLLMNPWLTGRSLAVTKGKTYKIKLPIHE